MADAATPGDLLATIAALERRVVDLEAQLAGRDRGDGAGAPEALLLRAVVDNVPGYVYAKDRDSRFLLANQATARLLGASAPGEVIGKSDRDFFPPEMAAEFYEDEQRLMESGQALLNHEEVVIDRATGERRWNLSTKVPLRDASGRIVGLVGLNWDITDRRRAEQAEREAAVQAELLRAQTALVEALSTPLLAIGDRALLLPLVGAVTPERAGKIVEVLGRGVVEHGAERVILDLTGASAFDAHAAQLIARAAAVVRLLGAELALSGVSPAVARQYVELGEGALAVKSYGTLRDAVAGTLERGGRPAR